MSQTSDDNAAQELVRNAVTRELPPGAPLPGDEEDLIEKGHIDSMGWVGILSTIEEATAIRNFGNPWPEGRPQSIGALVEMAKGTIRQAASERSGGGSVSATRGDSTIQISGWGCSLGSLSVEAASIERECGLLPGTIRDGAGIEAVRRASEGEDESTLAQRAVATALETAEVDVEAVDCLVATSATFLQFPSLATELHSRLLLRESCGALDVGGACAGLIYGFAVAKSLLLTNPHKVALVVASEIHSRRLASPGVPGEFRGLFGDGACAFLLERSQEIQDDRFVRLGHTVWGCSGTFSSSLRLRLSDKAETIVDFDGKQLASAAITQLDRVLQLLEIRSGRSRDKVDYFALHQPNPRMVEILAQRCALPPAKIPTVSRTCGNLGSVTCGASLCQALTESCQRAASPTHPLIFLAAVAPGLIWGGSYLH